MRRNLFRLWRSFRSTIGNRLARLTSNLHTSDIAIFHDFVPPPGGGGHQFLRALWIEFEHLGFRLENNTISPTTRACLFNSFNFDPARVRMLQRSTCRMIHRVDGPISAYRGKDEGIDKKIWEINQEFADETIFQSHYSYQKHLDMGLAFIHPYIIQNAADPRIFYPPPIKKPLALDQRVRLISVSWSDNPNKGTSVYQWLDSNLDWEKYQYTFVGRIEASFKHINIIPPVTSAPLSDILREHHIYIIASLNDPCSNSLIEALSCGLPAVYSHSGGHPEIVRSAGYAFNEKTEIPALLDRVINEYENLQRQIQLPSISDVAAQYLDVMGISIHKS